MKQNGLMLDIDCGHPFYSRSLEELNVEGLNAMIDQYEGTQVSHLFLNPNGMRTLYASDTWESAWQVDNEKLSRESEKMRSWVDHARILHERGIDPFVVWISRCHAKGISPWLSMRMNDSHYTDQPDHWVHGTFWREHPELRRVPGSTRGYIDQQLDFAHEAVRRRALNLIAELMDRYDADGISLDWMRMPQHFRPGHERAGGMILNEFMATVRAMAKERSKKRGRELRIAARVPAHPQFARGLGLDGIEWVRRGLVDILVPSPFWATADFDMPMELWRELLGRDAGRIKLVGGAEVLLGAWEFPDAQRSHCDIEALRGLAAGILHRGGDHVYLFNYFDRQPFFYSDAEYAQMIHQIGALPALLDKPRRHVVTYCDTTPPGVPRAFMLPVDLVGTDPAQFRLYIGPKPTRGKATLLVGLLSKTSVEYARIKINARCNSDPCGVGRIATGDVDFTKDQKLPSGAQFMLQFDVPPEHLQDGYNLLELFYAGGPAGRAVWVELRIDPSGQ